MTENEDKIEKTFDHSRGEVADQIALIGELEHEVRHSRRSTVSLINSEGDKWQFYQVAAIRAKQLRRELQLLFFPDLTSYDWCICKAASSIRQIAYEIDLEGPVLAKVDEFVDDMWGHALAMDLSDCVACQEDMEAAEAN